MAKKYDFGGYATRNNLVCTDGLIIRKDAFKDSNGQRVPLVWNHMHDDPENVLGHADLENREDGVYALCSFNDSPKAQDAKESVLHGDISALSIYANHVKKDGYNVMHGAIREVSLVLAGANPGAFIDTVIQHSDDSEAEAIMYLGDNIEVYHSDDEKAEEVEKEPAKQEEAKETDEVSHADDEKEETVQDVINSMTEKQQNVVLALIDAAMKVNEDSKEEDKEMKHNVFDDATKENQEVQDTVISHSDMQKALEDMQQYGSLKRSCNAHNIGDICIAHTDTDTRYGIMPKTSDPNNTYGIDALFPDARNYTNVPQWISRNTEWVARFMNQVSRSPFSRVKTMFADITEDEARAKGYLKGHFKKSEVFSLLKRTTSPTTVYKKQKFDRNDLIDITSFDVVAWIKGEMRVMLNEEIARAALIGDGRTPGTDDKIDEQCIRPIYSDADLFTVKVKVDFNANDTNPYDKLAKSTIRAAVKARKDYKGSGNPTFFTTEDVLTDMLLLEDLNGHVIYDTKEKLCNAMRVSDIVTVEVMEGVSRDVSGETRNLIGIIVNPKDYNFGADKGGEISMFDDFDIDYNQQKYLMETRLSGALVKPYSAIVLEYAAA